MKRLALARFLIGILRLVPKRHKLRGNPESIPQPFFILGSGRNGSTLLNQILNQHPSLFLPSEQYFLGNSIIKYQWYNYILWRDLVKIIYGELIQSTGGHSWDFSPDQIIPEAIEFKGEQRSLENIIHHIFCSYGGKSKQSFRIWGDTTPYNTQYTRELYSVFPEAKYIFLVRDGRDVAAAYKKAGNTIHDQLCEPENAARHWLKSIKSYDWLVKRSDVHLIRYEDLVIEPERTLKSLTEKLGVKYCSSMLDFHKNVSNVRDYQQPHHANLHNPINTDSIGQWNRLLTENEIRIVNKLISGKLAKFNYL